MLRQTITVISFNKALADLGLGTHGMTANVHKELRLEMISACLSSGASPKLAASRLFFVFDELGLISPSHSRRAIGRMDEWASKQLIPDPHELRGAVLELIEERREPEDDTEALCQTVSQAA